MKKVLKGVGLALLALAVLVGAFVGVEVARFDASMARVYPIAAPAITRSTDPAVIARGEHLARSFMACATADCHGADMAGGRTLDMGPVGRFTGPNLTLVAQAYSDGELARAVRHGLRRDGTSLVFMPASEINWVPDSDLVAVVSWIRTLAPIARPSGPLVVGLLAKVLDRREVLPLDVARHLDHAARANPPEPAPTAAYGAFIARSCTGCHGDHLSGGPIPGAPASMPTPRNITPHATGLATWSYEDFERMLREGVRKNGARLSTFMPVEALAAMNDTERRALWAYLRSVPPRPFGQR